MAATYPMAKLHRRTFLKQAGLGAAGLGLVSNFPACFSAGAGVFVSHKLPRGQPENQGVSSEAILNFLEAVESSKHEFHSFMMIRHGHVVAEGWWAPYREKANHMLYSLSKSFTSTAVGSAVTEGKFGVDDLVTSFFPDDLPETVSDHLAALRVKHLLTMSVGHAKDSTPSITKEENWVKAFLGLPIANPPGSNFLYNSGATYMLSAIVQKRCGQRVLDYLRPRLFEPLAIEGMTWETCPRGINTGGWGLKVPTEGLGKFGQLYLQKGLWNGRQILGAPWIEEATSFKIQQPPTSGPNVEHLKETSDWHQGYCYQFWRCRHNAFRGDGAFGQYAIVMPEQDAVIAITCETADMQSELDLVWEHLLPAMKSGPVPSNRRTDAVLKEKLESLSLPMRTSLPAPSMAAALSGRTFQVEPNALDARALSFDFERNLCTFTLTDVAGRHPIRCGMGKWLDGVTDMPGTPPKLTVGNLLPAKVAASGAWTDSNTFEMTWRFYETPHHDTVACHFDGESVEVKFMNSISEKSSSHPETRPALRAHV